MEIQTSKALSDVQQFRYELLQWCGNVEDAEKANTFVMGKDEKPVQAQLPKSGNMEDGIYLVHADGKATLFELEYTKDDNMDSEVVAIGLKMGSFGIKIALHDEANGDGITLTTKANGDEENDQAYYIDNYDDAVADMDGARNTNHWRNILNPQIKLADDWYIPSLGELYRIFINKKLSMQLWSLPRAINCKTVGIGLPPSSVLPTHGFCTSTAVLRTVGTLRPATRTELGQCQHLFLALNILVFNL